MQEEPTVLTSIVDRHKPLGLSATQLDILADTLPQTVREISKCDERTIMLWQEVIRPGLEYMREGLGLKS